MYLEHFGLLEAPFSIAPDPRYLYMSERHREALAHLLYGMETDGAFILLTGDVGTGKTTVSRCLLEQVPDDTNLALVLNPKLTSIELLQVICDELRISYDINNLSVKLLVDYINRNLLGAHAQGKKTVVLIEEAQNLDLDVLEQLRLLTNLETNERKLLQVILLGQPEFLDVLDLPELSQLAQRITARFHLGPLKYNEMQEYVSHRLAIAGCRRSLFVYGAIKRLYSYSGGVPRLINVICDRALLGCYVQNRHQVDKSTLVNAAQEVLGKNKSAAIKAKLTKPVVKYSAMAIIALMLMSALLYFAVFQTATNSTEDTATAMLSDQKKSVVDNNQQKGMQPAILSAEQASEHVIDNESVDASATQLNSTTMGQQATEQSTGAENTVGILNENQIAAGSSSATGDEKIQKSIRWPDSIQRLRSNLKSYQSLFERWQLNYDILVNGTPCFFAKTKGLSCVHKQSAMEGLRKFNRPAVLTLYDDSNRRQYVTLLALNENTATIAVAGETQIIPLQQLLFYWKGEFSLLWRQPAGYEDLIRPGSSGKVVSWLSAKMNEINHKPRSTRHSYYDKALVEQVKAFQLSSGLTNDGVVGIQTLVHINQATTEKTPLLESH